MAEQPVVTKIDARGTGWLILNRPHVHNAFDDVLIARLHRGLSAFADDPAVRQVAIAARGESFSAGADLNWMRRLAEAPFEDNMADAMRLAELLHTLDRLAKPTVAVVQGPAYGGGVGLVAACDIAIAARERARFALTEVRLGLVPATISPYVVAAIGSRQARRYMLTGERFDAGEARRIGLVHRVVSADELDGAVAATLEALTAGGPQALTSAKRLIAEIAARPIDAQLIRDTGEWISRLRASPEARERMAAFLERRTGERSGR